MLTKKEYDKIVAELNESVEHFINKIKSELDFLAQKNSDGQLMINDHIKPDLNQSFYELNGYLFMLDAMEGIKNKKDNEALQEISDTGDEQIVE